MQLSSKILAVPLAHGYKILVVVSQTVQFVAIWSGPITSVSFSEDTHCCVVKFYPYSDIALVT